MKNLEPVFADILQNAIDAIEGTATPAKKVYSINNEIVTSETFFFTLKLIDSLMTKQVSDISFYNQFSNSKKSTVYEFYEKSRSGKEFLASRLNFTIYE